MIGMIGALTDEVAALTEQMRVSDTQSIGGLTFYRGQLHGQEVVVVKSGVGKVNAAFAAATMCALYKPDGIINTGVAGGTVPRGQTVVSTRLVQHDFRGADGCPDGQIDGFDSPYFDADPNMVEALTAAAVACGVSAHKGTIVSGDRFVCDSTEVKRLAATFDAKAIDMESAAIAHVCKLTGVRFCALRTVTDNADESAVGDFYELLKSAAASSCKILLRYLAQL